MRTTLITTAALALMIASPVHADHCTTWSTTPADVDAGGYYVTEDHFVFCMLGVGLTLDKNICSFWVYEESNDIAGLQRGDEVVDDTCHGMIRPDTIVL